MEAPKNIIDLLEDQAELYAKLRNGEIGLDEAKQAANIAGKMISGYGKKMEYNKMIQSKSRIKFMED